MKNQRWNIRWTAFFSVSVLVLAIHGVFALFGHLVVGHPAAVPTVWSVIFVGSLLLAASAYFGLVFLADKRQQRDFYQTLISHLESGVAVFDVRGERTHCNEKAETFLSFLADQPGYRGWFSPPLAEESPVARVIQTGQPLQKELEAFAENERVWSLKLVATPLLDKDKKLKGCLCTLEDTLAQKKVEQQIQQLAFQDHLTRLPNRNEFISQLKTALANCRLRGGLLAIMTLDLDRFQTINDAIGRQNGDRLLQTIGTRLQQCKTEETFLARFSGDVFALMAPIASADEAAQMATDLIDSFNVPFTFDLQEIYISTSIGLVIAPADGDRAEDLCSYSTMAVSAAKARGGNTYHFYSKEIHHRVQERHTIEGELRKAVGTDQLYLVYQPQIHARTGQVLGVEALARWNHPSLGFISPGKFIPVAEETDFIRTIGEWTLQTACAQNRRWQQAGYPPLRIAVNLSGRQLQDEKVVDLVDEALKQNGLEARFLELEITETALIQEPQKTRHILDELKKRGLQVAMDDFGTGYSSLSYLNNFVIDRVKIDQSFVRGLDQKSGQADLVVTIIAMAKALGLEVIAEGVETRAELDFLQQHQCDEMQGYYFAKPMTVDALNRLFDDGYGADNVCLYSADTPARGTQSA